MRTARRALFLFLALAVLLSTGGVLATWQFSGGGIPTVTGDLLPTVGDFSFPTSVYITKAALTASTDANAQVLSYYDTHLRTAVSFGSSAGALATYRVEFRNNDVKDMAYAGVTTTEGGYPNPAIAYRISDILDGAIVKPGESLSLSLTFSYANGVPSLRDLTSELIFLFGEPIIFEEEVGSFVPGENYNTIIRNVLSNINGYGLNDSHKGHVVHTNLKTRGLLYNGDKGVSGGQLDKFHAALQVDDTKNIEFVLRYISDTEYEMYLFSKDSATVGADITVYRQYFHYDSATDKWGPGSALRGHAEIKTFTFNSRRITSIKPEDWTVGDAPTT